LEKNQDCIDDVIEIVTLEEILNVVSNLKEQLEEARKKKQETSKTISSDIHQKYAEIELLKSEKKVRIHRHSKLLLLTALVDEVK
jgi:hypothetical protein